MSDAQSSGDAVVMLRLDPIPTLRHVLNFEIDVRPASYTLDALETPSEVPVDDTLAYSTLVPLCEAEKYGINCHLVLQLPARDQTTFFSPSLLQIQNG